MGVQGAKPPGGGSWGGVPPQNQKRGRVARISNPATSGTPKRWQTLSQRGWAMGGPGGEASWRGVVGGVPPQNQKRGRVARISNPATSGTQNAGKP